MKFTALVLVAVLLASCCSGCASSRDVPVPVTKGDKVVLENHTIHPHGLWAKIDETAKKNEINPAVRYEISWGNVVWGCLLVETIIAPVVIFGWYLWEPVDPASGSPTDCSIPGTCPSL